MIPVICPGCKKENILKCLTIRDYPVFICVDCRFCWFVTITPDLLGFQDWKKINAEIEEKKIKHG